MSASRRRLHPEHGPLARSVPLRSDRADARRRCGRVADPEHERANPPKGGDAKSPACRSTRTHGSGTAECRLPTAERGGAWRTSVAVPRSDAGFHSNPPNEVTQ